MPTPHGPPQLVVFQLALWVANLEEANLLALVIGGRCTFCHCSPHDFASINAAQLLRDPQQTDCIINECLQGLEARGLAQASREKANQQGLILILVCSIVVLSV